MNNPLVSRLVQALQLVEAPGSFAVGGRLASPMPDLVVEGVGQIAFPLLEVQARALCAVAHQAPYGRGAQTLVDTEVRRVWQFDAGEFSVGGPGFADTLKEVVERTRQGLGLTPTIEARPYKLLLYEAGSFFVEHRDNEKLDGMFGTLVVVLPSIWSGGELCVRHAGKHVELPLNSPSVGEISWGAFYADCAHEVRPLKEGYRLALVYNLVITGESPAPRAPDHRAQVEDVSQVLSVWEGQPAIKPGLVWILSHKYTPAGLAWGGLKNADAGVAQVLKEAAEKARCACYLGVVSIRESGPAEYIGYVGRRRWGHSSPRQNSPESFEIIEVDDRSEHITGVVATDNGRPLVEDLGLSLVEVCPHGALEGAEPDEQSFSEASGNEGGSFERAWRFACLLVWPWSRTHELLNEQHYSVAMTWLKHLVTSPGASMLPADLPRTLLRGVLDDLAAGKQSLDSTRWTSQRHWLVAVFEALLTTGDRELMKRFLTEPNALPKVFDFDQIPMVERAFALLGWEDGAACLAPLLRGAGYAHFSAGVRLLNQLSAHPQALSVRPRLCAVTRELCARLPELSQSSQWEPVEVAKQRTKCSAAVTDLCQLVARLEDEDLAQLATRRLLEEPRPFGMDEVLIPACEAMLSSRATAEVSRALREGCLLFLNQRIALPLEPPADWSRTGTLQCNCPDCVALARFLVDPTAASWTFKAAQERRQHVQSSASRATPDLEFSTLKRSSPHELLLKKTSFTFERRTRERASDLKRVASLSK